MWAKILTFVAGAVIATIITLWTKDNMEEGQATGGRTFHGGNSPDNWQPAPTPNDTLTCAICMENDKDTVLRPCGHMCCCLGCASQVAECPICRSRITHRMRVFIS